MTLRGSLFFQPLLILFALASPLGVYAHPGQHGATFETRKQKAEKKPQPEAPTREERRAERKKKAEAQQLAARKKKVAREIARKERLIAARGYGNIHRGTKKPENPSLLTRMVENVAWTARDVADYVRANPPEIEFYVSLKICGIPLYERRLYPPPFKAPKPQPSPLYPRLTEIPRFREE